MYFIIVRTKEYKEYLFYQTIDMKKMCSISEVIEDCDLNNDFN